MKLFSVIKKSFKEQIRSFWILILTVSMAPFFVFLYYLINESSKPVYDLLIINQDNGIIIESDEVNYGDLLVETLEQYKDDSLSIPLDLNKTDNRTNGIQLLKNKKADALVIIPPEFSETVQAVVNGQPSDNIEIEFVGDLTSIGYMVTAIWVGEILDQSVFYLSGTQRPYSIRETSLGISGEIDDFDIYIPGILVLSIIMLMFTASIALITEVENKTILRLKLSRVGSFRLLGGISIVQVMVGLLSVFITLVIALWMGFNYTGSVAILFLIAIITCLSIISFSLIVAGFTKTVNEILVVGNFPLFLFMFFTGAAFPINGKEIFSIGGYPFSIQGMMSPTHAIAALRKTLVLDMGLRDILPEISFIIFLTLLYFLVGVWLFRRRHMKIR